MSVDSPSPVGSPSSASPVLHMVCGKIASGKSSLTGQLAQAPLSVLISEDVWLARLYPGEITTVSDYARCAGRLRDAMAVHVRALLQAGVSVVLDFPANTIGTRQWARQLIDESGVAHQLHFLDVPDDVCKARLRARNASGTHAYRTSDEVFEQMTRYFVAPTDDEGFNVVLHN